MIIRANTTSVHTVYFYDEGNTPVQPSSGSYQVKDVNTNTLVVTPTSFTPSTPYYQIVLTPAQNAMLTSTDLVENRELKITFVYGGTKQGAASEVTTLNGSNITVPDVMDNLFGWNLDTDVDDDEYDATEDMVETYIIKAIIRAANYLKLASPNSLPTTSDVINEAVSIWAAGLLYSWKYTMDTPEATSLRYGFNLITDAKRLLDQYMETSGTGGGGIAWTTDNRLGEWDETSEYYAYTEKGIKDLDENDEDVEYDEVR